MAQTELRQAVPIAHPIQPRILTRPHQVAGGLQLRRRHVNRLEQSARMQARQLARVTRIGLHPVARPLRHQPRSDHLAIDPALDQMPVETETGRTRLIAAAHPGPTPQ